MEMGEMTEEKPEYTKIENMTWPDPKISENREEWKLGRRKGMTHEEVFKVYCAEGPIGLERLKQEGKILDYAQGDDGRYSINLIGHVESMKVTMSVGVWDEEATDGDG